MHEAFEEPALIKYGQWLDQFRAEYQRVIFFWLLVSERFRQRSSHLKRSVSLLWRNSGRETGSHPCLRGGMLSLELL